MKDTKQPKPKKKEELVSVKPNKHGIIYTKEGLEAGQRFAEMMVENLRKI